MRRQWWGWGVALALLLGAQAGAQGVARAPRLVVIIPADDQQSYALARATNQRLRRQADSSALVVYSQTILERDLDGILAEPVLRGPKSGAAGGPAMLPHDRAQLALLLRADILIAFAPDSTRPRTDVTVLVSRSPKLIDARALGTWHIDDIGQTAQRITAAILRDSIMHRDLTSRR